MYSLIWYVLGKLEAGVSAPPPPPKPPAVQNLPGKEKILTDEDKPHEAEEEKDLKSDPSDSKKADDSLSGVLDNHSEYTWAESWTMSIHTTVDVELGFFTFLLCAMNILYRIHLYGISQMEESKLLRGKNR